MELESREKQLQLISAQMATESSVSPKSFFRAGHFSIPLSASQATYDTVIQSDDENEIEATVFSSHSPNQTGISTSQKARKSSAKRSIITN